MASEFDPVIILGTRPAGRKRQKGRMTRRASQGPSRLTPPETFAAFFAGQSLAEYPFIRGTPRVAKNFAEDICALFDYSTAGTVTSYQSGQFFHDGANENAEDWTVRLDNAASGGSALLDVSQSGSQIASGNYWWNTQDNTATNDPEDVANSPGPLWRALISRIETRVAAGKKPNAFYWSQGTTDLTANTTILATYKTVLKNLFNAVRDAAETSLPIFFMKIHSHQTANDDGLELMRQLQREVIAETSSCYVGAEEYPWRKAVATSHANAGTTDGSNVVTIASTTGLAVNDGIEGAGIPDGAYITTVTTDTSITLSRRKDGIVIPAPATATATVTIYRKDDTHLYPGPDGVQPLDANGGTTHTQTDGFYGEFETLAYRTAYIFGAAGVGESLGPFISSILAARGANKVRVNFTHNSGNDIVIGDDDNPDRGWRVLVDGVAQTIIGINKISATAVDVLLGGTSITGSTIVPIFGSEVSVEYAYGGMNFSDHTRFIFDNASPVSFPVQAKEPIVNSVLPYISDGGTLSVTLVDRVGELDDLSTYTFAGRSLGTAAADRKILLGVSKRSGAANIFGDITINGVKARPLIQVVSGSNLNRTAFFIADVPNDETGDIVVNTVSQTSGAPSTSNRCGIAVFRVTGANSVTAVNDAQSSIVDNETKSITVVPNSVVVGYVFIQPGTLGTTTWTGLDEVFDEIIEATDTGWHSAAMRSFVSGGVQNVAADYSQTATNGIGAVYVNIAP